MGRGLRKGAGPRLRSGLGIVVIAFSLSTIHGHAGSNGQQIQYLVECDSDWSEATGYNQNGDYEDRFYSTPANQDSDCSGALPSYQDHGWWWVGSVHVTGWGYYDGSQPDGYNGDDYCNVPQSYDYDYWGCDTP